MSTAVRAWARDLHTKTVRAQARNHYLAGACVALLMIAIAGWMRPAHRDVPALECPSLGVMQLDPTTIRATGGDAQWL